MAAEEPMNHQEGMWEASYQSDSPRGGRKRCFRVKGPQDCVAEHLLLEYPHARLHFPVPLPLGGVM